MLSNRRREEEFRAAIDPFWSWPSGSRREQPSLLFMKQSSGQNLLVNNTRNHHTRLPGLASVHNRYKHEAMQIQKKNTWRPGGDLLKQHPMIGKSKQRRAKVKQTRVQRDRSHRSAYRFIFFDRNANAKSRQCQPERRNARENAEGSIGQHCGLVKQISSVCFLKWQK